MSNCHNAGLDNVWISQQYNPVSLSDHLSGGRPWDLDRTSGGLLTLQPRLGHDDREGFQQGTADGIWKYAPLIRDFAPDSIVVLSADAVYSLDYGAVIDEHMEAGAGVTMVTTEVDPDDASRYGVVQAQGGKVAGYELKPDEPDGNLVCDEVFVFEPSALLDTLEEIAADAGEDGLKDLGHELLPRLVDAGKAREYRFTDYWRDVGTVAAYWQCHQELIADEPPINLDDPGCPSSPRPPPSALLRTSRATGRSRRACSHPGRGSRARCSAASAAAAPSWKPERSYATRSYCPERSSAREPPCGTRSSTTRSRSRLRRRSVRRTARSP